MAVIGTIRNKAGWLIIAIVGFGLAAFILGDLFNSNRSMFSSDTSVAEIAGDKVSIQEFEERVQRIIDNYKLNSGEENIEQSLMDMLREQAWTQLVDEIVLKRQYEAAGVTVTSDELFDMVQGKNPHPQVQKAFTDPKTGVFNASEVVRFLKNMDQDPSGASRERWVAFEKALQDERISQKYNNLIKQALYVTTFEAKQDYINKGKMAKIKYLVVNYNTIPDSTITPTENELREYYNSHQYQYKQETSRKIEYVTFEVTPSEEDKFYTQKWISDQYEDFKNANNDTLFLKRNGVTVDNTFYKKGSLPDQLDSVMFASPAGTMVGPYFENNAYKLAKLSEVKQMPDSVKARHILLKINEGEDAEKVKAEADSLRKLIKGGASFDELAKTLSEDPGSASKGGDLGWFKEGTMVKPFNDSCFNGKKGDMPIVESSFGVHLIEIRDIGKTDKRVRVSILEKNLEPGDKTHDSVFYKASEFASKYNTAEAFEKAVTEQGLSKRIADNLKEADKRIPGLDSPRELIRWAYQAKKGEISKVYQFDNKYVVAHLTEVNEEGVSPLENIKEEITAAVRKEKKAKMISEKLNNQMKEAASMEVLGRKLGQLVQTADHLSFSSSNIPGLGRELSLIGTIFTLKEDQISKPIEGETGVFIVMVESFTEPPDTKDYSASKNQMQQYIQQQADNSASEALKEQANIIDNRGKFY